jgi:hypothetical protein
MRRPIDRERQAKKQQREPGIRRHPGLRLAIVEAPDQVDIDRRHARIGLCRRHQEIADRQHDAGYGGPCRQRAAVVAHLPDQIEQQERQPAVKQREPAQKQRAVALEHIIGQTRGAQPEKIEDVINHPQRLRQQQTHRAHRDQKRIVEPQTRKREQKCEVTEVEEVSPAVLMKVDRDQHRHEGGIEKLDREQCLQRDYAAAYGFFHIPALRPASSQ